MLLRHPRAHLLSMYRHCRYSGWGRWRSTSFPRNGTLVAGFGKWLAHFQELRERGYYVLANTTSMPKALYQAGAKYDCFREDTDRPWAVRSLTRADQDRGFDHVGCIVGGVSTGSSGDTTDGASRRCAMRNPDRSCPLADGAGSH